MTNRPSQLEPDLLAQVRATQNVGLFHIGDEQYKDPLDAYDSFNYVWRQYAHSWLLPATARSIPLGPNVPFELGEGIGIPSRTPASQRAHPVAFIGALVTTRFACVRAMRTIDNAYVHVSGRFDHRPDPLPPVDYMAALRRSAIVACPMGNANLEACRVYEALEAGAIPLLERRSRYDYWGMLLGSHPLPEVTSWPRAVGTVSELTADPDQLDELQRRTVSWWANYKRDLAAAMRRDVEAGMLIGVGSRRPVPPGNMRIRGAIELARHHNATAIGRRVHITAVRLVQRGSLKKPEGPAARRSPAPWPLLRTPLRIWRHPANHGLRLQRYALWVGWQVWERTLRRPWQVTMPPGVTLELTPHDPVTSGVLYCGLPDWPEMPFLLEYLKPGDVMVDVGANVGLYSLLAATVPEVQVLAFEPNAAARSRLTANADRNRLLTRIDLRSEAVGAAPGRAAITMSFGPGNRLVDTGETHAAPVDVVKVVALDECVDGAVALIKIDVEGAEPSVLKGAARTLEAFRPALILEVNDPAALTDLLRPLGYQWVTYEPQQRRIVPTTLPKRGANGIAVVDIEAAVARVALSPPILE